MHWDVTRNGMKDKGTLLCDCIITTISFHKVEFLGVVLETAYLFVHLWTSSALHRCQKVLLQSYCHFNLLPDDEILDWFKLKQLQTTF